MSRIRTGWPRSRRFIAAALLAACGAAAVLYWVISDGDSATRAQEPGDRPASSAAAIDPDDTSITPVPGTTPDTSIPFWYVPYLNADRQKVPFKGDLNGFAIDPSYVDDGNPYELCPPDGFTAPTPSEVEALPPAARRIVIDPALLPAGVERMDGPWTWACHGELVFTHSVFSVASGTPGANPGGGSVMVDRSVGLSTIPYAAPEERWSALSIQGSPAVVSREVVEADGGQFGSCYAAVYEPETDVLTQVTGSASNADLCVAIAESLLQ